MGRYRKGYEPTSKVVYIGENIYSDIFTYGKIYIVKSYWSMNYKDSKILLIDNNKREKYINIHSNYFKPYKEWIKEKRKKVVNKILKE